MTSVLSQESDNFGYYYGFVPGDRRRIDIRQEPYDWLAPNEHLWYWRTYVDGELLPGLHASKGTAEAVARLYIESNPDK